MTAPTSIIQLATDPMLLGEQFGPSWRCWKAILAATYGEPMDDWDRAAFRELTGREPPAGRARELWIGGPRRSGKSAIASLIACHAGITDYRDRLRSGEKASVLVLARDREQAGGIKDYVTAYFADNPLLRAMVVSETRDGLLLNNRSEIIIATSDFRSVRGKTVSCAILDEAAFWQGDGGASPDVEVYRALVPATMTLRPDAMIVGISTLYGRKGLMFRKFREAYGQDSDVIFVRASAKADYPLNPTLDQAAIDRDVAEDPESGGSEWLAEFRSDLASYLEPETLDAVTAIGRYEVPPMGNVAHVAFCDPAGGSGQDSFALAIGHLDGNIGVLSVCVEWKPPFVANQVVAECCEILKRYRVSSVQADRWGAEFVREAFSQHGINCEQSARPKSDLYRELLPAITSRRVEILDLPKLRTQFLGLERRVARGGRDSIDHADGGHDDLSNAATGCLVQLTAGRDFLATWLALVGHTPESAGFRDRMRFVQ